MKLNSIVIDMLSEKCGCDVSTPAGATALAIDIESKTGERLAPNTLKRLVGVIDYPNAPRITTLDIIARYLGYPSWEHLQAVLNHGSSFFGNLYTFVEVSELDPGTEIYFRWEPNREITLRHQKDGKCEVVEVANSKLSAGDILELTQLAEGFPFYVKDVIRGEEHLGAYNAASELGIHILRIFQR